jgi:hypothetical protein
MATTIKLKNSVTTTGVPTALAQGEVAINITDKKVWVGNAATTPVQIVGAGAGGGAGGSDTQVQYNSSGALAGSSSFVWDNANSRLVIPQVYNATSISLTSPSVSINNAAGTAATLNLNASAGTGQALLWFLGGGSGNPTWDIGTTVAPNTFSIGYTTSSTRTERLRITSAGYVGINCTPSYQFQVNGYTYIAGVDAGIITTGTTGGPWTMGAQTGDFAIIESSVAQRITIKASTGYVGIGTTSPSAQLQFTAYAQSGDDLTSSAYKIGSQGSFLGRRQSDGSTVLNSAQGSLLFSAGTTSSYTVLGSMNNSTGLFNYSFQIQCGNDYTTSSYQIGNQGSYLGRDSATGATKLYTGQDSIRFGSGGTEWMRLASGLVGIGKVPSGYLVDTYYNAGGNVMRLSVDDGVGSSNFGTDYYINNRSHTIARISSFYNSSAGSGYGGLYFGTNNGAGVVTRMTIATAGAVGIGTTDPTSATYNSGSLLTTASSSARAANIVAGKANSGTANENGQWILMTNEGPAQTGRSSGVEAGRLYFRFSQPSSGAIQDAGAISVESSTASGGQSGGVTQSDMIFYTTSVSSTMSEKMRINYLGYVGISTSTSTSALEVAGEGGQAYGQALYVSGTNTGYGGSGLFGVNCARAATSGIGLAQFRSANTLVCQIRGDGSLVNTTGSYGTISDVRLKENIVDATPKLDDVLKLQVRNFNLKSDQNHKQIGFIAQELEQVFPSMIDENTDGFKTVKTSTLIPILVKAMQEQQALIEQLTTRLNALEGK